MVSVTATAVSVIAAVPIRAALVYVIVINSLVYKGFDRVAVAAVEARVGAERTGARTKGASPRIEFSFLGSRAGQDFDSEGKKTNKRELHDFY